MTENITIQSTQLGDLIQYPELGDLLLYIL